MRKKFENQLVFSNGNRNYLEKNTNQVFTARDKYRIC